MALTAGTPEQLQKGFAYLAHASRGDALFLQAAGEDLGGWSSGCLVFAACTVELLYQLSRLLNEDVTDLAERLSVASAAASTREPHP